LPGTVEAIVLIVFSGGNTRCSSLASDEPVERTADRANNARAEPRAFIVSAFMMFPLLLSVPGCARVRTDSGK
jgi:hypothetical protein